MKTKVSLLLIAVLLNGCIAPNFSRLVPENKDADIEVIYPYGTIRVKSRVVGSTNTGPIAPLP